jgi:hypothetical protein
MLTQTVKSKSRAILFAQFCFLRFRPRLPTPTLLPFLPVPACATFQRVKIMLQSRAIAAALHSHAFRRSYSSIGVFPDLVKDKTVQLTNSRGVNVIHDPLLSKGIDPTLFLFYVDIYIKLILFFTPQVLHFLLLSENAYLSVVLCLPGARRWTSSWPV